MTAATVLLAAALLAGARPATVRRRAGLPPPPRRPRRRPAGRDPLATAASLDVFGLCLTAGMTVPAAARATARSAPAPLASVLRRGADLLTLGAGPDAAWSAPPERRGGSLDPSTQALLRLARRSGSSGTALAAGASDLAAQCRADATHAATAAAERAAVLIAGPLAGCFLPAFVCLGLVPVVAGLAGDLLRSGLW